MEPYSEQDQPPQQRHRRGCLWGCLASLVVAVVVIVAVFGYGAWHFFGILNDDANVQTIMETVNRSDEAKGALGNTITVMARERRTYSHETGRGDTATYVLRVVGPRGEGEVKADLNMSGAKAKITALILTDAEGQPHYIIGGAPPNPMMQNSI